MNKNILNSLNKIIILLIIFLTPLIFSSKMALVYHSPKNLFIEFFSILSLGFFLTQMLFNHNFHFQLNIIDVAIILHFLSISVCFIFLPKYESFFCRTNILICLLIIYFIVKNLIIKYSNNFTQKIYLALFINGLVLSFLGFLQFIGIDPISSEKFVYFESPVVGTMGNANSIGGYLAAVLPFGLYFLIKSKFKSMFGLALTVMLLALLLTLSRGAWIGFFGGIAIFFNREIRGIWIYLKSRRRLFILFVFTFFIVVGLLIYVLFKINPDSAKGRLFLWKVSWEMVQDSPWFGVGYGNYPVKYLDYQAKFFTSPKNAVYFDKAANIKQAHNEYLQVWAETGITGLFIFCFIIYNFYVTAIFLLRHCKIKDMQLIIITIIASYTTILIHALVDCPLRVLPITLAFFVNMALISGLQKKMMNEDFTNKENQFGTQQKFPWRVGLCIDRKIVIPNFKLMKIVLIVIIWGGVAFGVSHLYGQMRGYIYWRNAQYLSAMDRLESSLDEYLKALNYLPWKGELHFNIGGVYTKLQQYDKAINEFDIASKNFNDKNLYISKGIAFERSGKNLKAEKNYKKALAMYPKLLLPRYLLGRLYYRNKEIDQAVKMLEEIEKIIPKIKSDQVRLIKNAAKELLNKVTDKYKVLN